MSTNHDHQTCIMCGETKTIRNVTVVDEILTEILNVLTIRLDIDSSIVRFICNSCLEHMYRFFTFKSKCLETEDYLAPYLCQIDGSSKLDLLELIVDTSSQMNVKKMKDLYVCRLCKNFVCGKVFIALFDFLGKDERRKVFEKYIPEVRLEVTDNPIICGPCQKTFKTIYNYIAFTSSSLEFNLLVNESIKNMNESEMSTENSHMVEIYSCDLCSYKSVKKELLRKHKIAHSDTVYECKQCVYATNRKAALRIHINISHEAKNQLKNSFHCQTCSYKTHCEYYLKKHILICKNKEQEHEETFYKCNICKFSTKTKFNLKRHMIKHDIGNEGRRYYCLHCKFVTKYKRALIQHLPNHRKIDEANLYKCPQCPYKSSKKVYLNVHIKRKHTNTEIYTCDGCSYKATAKNDLQAHIKIKHLGIDNRPTHKCELCTYQTKNSSHIKRHMLVHAKSESKLFKCEKCLYQTNFKDNFKKHELVHKTKTEVELFQCKHCNYKTKYKGYLKTHEKIHKNPSTDAKEYKCDYCQYTTLFSGNLTHHTTRHHQPEKLKKFTCGECDFTTTLKGTLVNHFKAVHCKEECEFKCTKCKYETQIKASFQRHMRAMHS